MAGRSVRLRTDRGRALRSPCDIQKKPGTGKAVAGLGCLGCSLRKHTPAAILHLSRDGLYALPNIGRHLSLPTGVADSQAFDWMAPFATLTLSPLRHDAALASVNTRLEPSSKRTVTS